MAARKYGISLRVLKNISRVSAKKCSIYYINTNEIPIGVKGAIYYLAIAKVIFSHVKITCYFHT